MGEARISVTFHGVRGSTPCHGPDTLRYGGNTSCVSLEIPGENPILCDLGTGLRYFGESWVASGRPFVGTALLSHLHWDHVQGIPFFAPVLEASTQVDIYGPAQEDGTSLRDALRAAVRPPTFPVGLEELPGRFRFHEVADSEFSAGSVRIISRSVPHVGPTVGFRIEWGGRAVAYIPDHQQCEGGSFTVPAGVRDLVEGADLVIHDSQYTPEEFRSRRDWGHCTAEFAMSVAASCGAKSLALFHHDPGRTDDALDAAGRCPPGGVRVFAARENQVVVV